MIEYDLPLYKECTACKGEGYNITYTAVGQREESVCPVCEGRGGVLINEDLELETGEEE